MPLLEQSLKKHLKELQIRLQSAYEREDQVAALKAQPILYTKEFLALNNEDVRDTGSCMP